MRFHSSLSSFLLSIFIIAMSLPAVSCKPRGLKIKPYPTPHVIASTPAGTQQGDVALSYTLIEVDGSGSDVSLQYSTDGGSSWLSATAKGGSGTTDVKGVIYPGVGRTIVWDSVADVVGYETCRVRIVARKSLSGKTGTPDETGQFEVRNPQVPVISWVSKPEGTVREVPLTFTWQYDTPQFPIQGYFYNLDGQPPMQTVSTSVTIPAPSTGMHTFQVYAASLTGNVSNLLEATFTCDNAALNQPPTVVITSGPSGTTTDTKPTFEYIGSDPDGFVQSYFVSIDVNPPDIWISANSWTSPELSCGSHTFYVMAQDNDGANSSVVSRTFTVDIIAPPNQPPTVNILTGPSGDTFDNTPTFTYEGFDNDGIISGYFVSIDVNPPDIWTTQSFWTSPELPLGPHSFYVIARDNDGANSSIVWRSFDVKIPTLIYVDGTIGDNANDGLSWATAVKTIAKGLEKAPASGCTVLVADGTYTGPNNKDLNFNGKSIYLVSATGPQNCIIDCQEQGRGFHFFNGEGNSAVIESISIINGNVAAYAYPSGGAILVESGCAPKIINCVMESCAADPKGGGIYCGDSTDVELVNCVVKDNYAANCGGGVFISEFASGKLSDCVIDRNSSGDYCGGIFAAAVRMENCSITRNTATFSQGGAFIIGNSVLTGCTIFANRAKANGGDSGGAYVICDSAETSRIINCLIVSNQAGGCGGGLDLIGGLHMIINCTFANNFALEDGGGIRIQGNTDAQIYNSIIWANIAGNEGNQINSWQLTSIAVLQFCDFENNTLNPNNIKGPGSFSEFNCLHTDPQFLIFPADEDYHLGTSSPCIDAGCNAYVTAAGITEDLDGKPRIVDGNYPSDGTATVDMGAYEYLPPGSLIWAKEAGNGFGDSGRGISTFSDGSSVVTGFFLSTAIFGAGEENETVLLPFGNDDIFIARFTPDGTLQWAKSAGSTGNDVGRDVTAIPDGSAIVTGYFSGSATFGAGEGNQTILLPAGGYDMFIAKYNLDGTFAWAKNAGGAGDDGSTSISAFSDGAVLVTGYFESTATFGEGEGNETILTSAGNRDIFISKYNPDGTLVWAKSILGAEWDTGWGVSALPDDSAILVGHFTNTATFGSGEGNQTVLISAGGRDSFIAKYNPNGTLNWVKSAGSTDSVYGQDASTLPDGTTTIVGYFDGNNATFGLGEGNETVFSSDGGFDVFVAKYNPDGTLAWAKRAGGTGSDLGRGISVIPDGSTVVTGYFGGFSASPATFGKGEVNETVLSSTGWSDIFVAKYNSDGTVAWAKSAGGSSDEMSWAISALSDGSSIVTGYFEGNATFGAGEVNETILTGFGAGDIFIAKFSP